MPGGGEVLEHFDAGAAVGQFEEDDVGSDAVESGDGVNPVALQRGAVGFAKAEEIAVKADGGVEVADDEVEVVDGVGHGGKRVDLAFRFAEENRFGLGDGEGGEGDRFLAGFLATYEGDGGGGKVELLGEEAEEFGVGFVIDGGGVEFDFDGGSVTAHDSTFGRVGDNVQGDELG